MIIYYNNFLCKVELVEDYINREFFFKIYYLRLVMLEEVRG